MPATVPEATPLGKTLPRPGEKIDGRGKRAAEVHPTESVINGGAACSDTNGPTLGSAAASRCMGVATRQARARPADHHASAAGSKQVARCSVRPSNPSPCRLRPKQDQHAAEHRSLRSARPVLTKACADWGPAQTAAALAEACAQRGACADWGPDQQGNQQGPSAQLTIRLRPCRPSYNR